MSTEPSQIREDLELTHRALRSDAEALADRVNPGKRIGEHARHLRGSLTEARRRLREFVVGAASDTAEQVSRAGTTAAAAARSGSEEVRAQAEGRPLTAGLLAFGAGFLASTLFPPSAPERDTARRLTDRTAELATEQAEPLRRQAAEAGSEAAEGLAEPAREAAGAVGRTAREAASNVAAPLGRSGRDG